MDFEIWFKSFCEREEGSEWFTRCHRTELRNALYEAWKEGANANSAMGDVYPDPDYSDPQKVDW